jgi:hypothetical protein
LSAVKMVVLKAEKRVEQQVASRVAMTVVLRVALTVSKLAMHLEKSTVVWRADKRGEKKAVH